MREGNLQVKIIRSIRLYSLILWAFVSEKIGFSFKNVLKVYLQRKLSEDFNLSLYFSIES